MRQIIVLAVIIAIVADAAVPARREYYSPGEVQILRYDVDNIGSGNYKYAYEQTDGTRQEQQGTITNEGSENEAIAVKGSFSWVAPDGVRYTITYTADDNGYKPELEEGPGGLAGDALLSSLGYEATNDRNPDGNKIKADTTVNDSMSLVAINNYDVYNINITEAQHIPYRMDNMENEAMFLSADLLGSALGR